MTIFFKLPSRLLEDRLSGNGIVSQQHAWASSRASRMCAGRLRLSSVCAFFVVAVCIITSCKDGYVLSVVSLILEFSPFPNEIIPCFFFIVSLHKIH